MDAGYVLKATISMKKEENKHLQNFGLEGWSYSGAELHSAPRLHARPLPVPLTTARTAANYTLIFISKMEMLDWTGREPILQKKTKDSKKK